MPVAGGNAAIQRHFEGQGVRCYDSAIGITEIKMSVSCKRLVNMQVNCPTCGKLLKIRRELLGQVVRCPCGAQLKLQSPKPSNSTASAGATLPQFGISSSSNSNLGSSRSFAASSTLRVSKHKKSRTNNRRKIILAFTFCLLFVAVAGVVFAAFVLKASSVTTSVPASSNPTDETKPPANESKPSVISSITSLVEGKGYLGVNGQAQPDGWLVIHVSSKPAKTAGLKWGDLLVSANGVKFPEIVTPTSIEYAKFKDQLEGKVGDAVTLKVKRDEQLLTIQIPFLARRDLAQSNSVINVKSWEAILSESETGLKIDKAESRDMNFKNGEATVVMGLSRNTSSDHTFLFPNGNELEIDLEVFADTDTAEEQMISLKSGSLKRWNYYEEKRTNLKAYGNETTRYAGWKENDFAANCFDDTPEIGDDSFCYQWESFAPIFIFRYRNVVVSISSEEKLNGFYRDSAVEYAKRQLEKIKGLEIR